MLETWIDQARLIAVIGTKRWTDLNGICERASEFVRKERIKDSGFISKLAEKNVFNADEISSTLQRNFKIVPTESKNYANKQIETAKLQESLSR